MISKERLEALIKEGATVYEVKYTYKGLYVDEYNLKNIPTYYKSHLDFFQDIHIIFETKEETEWYREFGCVERTERLELPTWEDVSKDFIPLKVGSGQYPVVEFGDNSIEIIVNVNKDIQIVLWCNFISNFEAPLTKENYILACRKCKELFLAEN